MEKQTNTTLENYKICSFCDLREEIIKECKIPCMRNPNGTFHEIKQKGNTKCEHLQGYCKNGYDICAFCGKKVGGNGIKSKDSSILNTTSALLCKNCLAFPCDCHGINEKSTGTQVKPGLQMTTSKENWKKIEKELEHIATYANPERHTELLSFLKGQFKELLTTQLSSLLSEIEDKKTGTSLQYMDIIKYPKETLMAYIELGKDVALEEVEGLIRKRME